MRLAPVANESFDQTVEKMAALPGAHARVTAPVAPLQRMTEPVGPYRIVSHEPGWLTLSDELSAVRVPVKQVQSVSVYDHGRGAIEGALGAGAAGVLVGFGAGFMLASMTGCSASAVGACSVPSPVPSGLVAAGVVGLIFAALGAGVGAIVGHETRYEVVAAP